MIKRTYWFSALLLVTLTVGVHAQTNFPTLTKHQIAGGIGYQYHAVSTSEAHNGIFGYSGHIVKGTFFYAYQEQLIFSASAGLTSADTETEPSMESALYSDAAILYHYTLKNTGIRLFGKAAMNGLIKGETEIYPYLETYAMRAGGGVVYQKLAILRPFFGLFYENRRGHQSTGFQVVANLSDTYLLTEIGIATEFGKSLNLVGSVEVPFNAGEVVIRINTNYKF